MRERSGRIDPVQVCLFTLCGVAVLGFGLNRATPAAQLVTCWFLTAVMHLTIAAVAPGSGRYGRVVAIAGGLLAAADLAVLTWVISDPASSFAAGMEARRWLMGVVVLVATVPAVIVRWHKLSNGVAEQEGHPSAVRLPATGDHL